MAIARFSNVVRCAVVEQWTSVLAPGTVELCATSFDVSESEETLGGHGLADA